MKQLENELQKVLNRYKAINKYALTLMEQVETPPVEEDPNAAPLPPPTETPAGAADTPGLPGGDGTTDPTLDADSVVPDGDGTMPTDPAAEAPAAEVPAADDTSEEIDITDLVNMTKNIKQELENSKNNNSGVEQKMEGVFTKLYELEQKLSAMDDLISKIDQLGSRIEQIKPQTPQEKLEMRSLDSYPFNEKPQEFFAKKQDDMRASGKNEYVLTKSDVENYNKEDTRTSFNPFLDDSDISGTNYR